MRRRVTKSEKIELTITITMLYHLCLLLVVRLGGHIMNLSDLYSYRIIGKLTAFMSLQEFIVYSDRGLHLTYTGSLSHLSHILSHRIRNLLVY
jgi:hypothetical protein